MENSNNSGKIIGALLVGAAVGGILGILFAPNKGSETRKKIAGSASDLSNSLKQKFSSLVGEAKAEMENGRDKVTEFAENVIQK
jgi:gas vesicle protein